MEQKTNGRGTVRSTLRASLRPDVKCQETGVSAARNTRGAVRTESAPKGGFAFSDDSNRADVTWRHRERKVATLKKVPLGLSLRVATVNVGTMTRRANNVMEMVGRREIDFCSVQEIRWKGENARMIEGGDKRYKFFWKGCNEVGGSGVGILVAEKWVEKVVDVRRISEQIMVLKVAIGKQVFNIVCICSPSRKICSGEGKVLDVHDGRNS